MAKIVTSQFHKAMINPILFQIYDSSRPEFQIGYSCQDSLCMGKVVLTMSHSNRNGIMDIFLIVSELIDLVIQSYSCLFALEKLVFNIFCCTHVLDHLPGYSMSYSVSEILSSLCVLSTYLPDLCKASSMISRRKLISAFFFLMNESISNLLQHWREYCKYICKNIYINPVLLVIVQEFIL